MQEESEEEEECAVPVTGLPQITVVLESAKLDVVMMRMMMMMMMMMLMMMMLMMMMVTSDRC